MSRLENDVKRLPSKEYLDACFIYNKDTGFLYWKERPLNHFKSLRHMNAINSKMAGKKAFSIRNDGYGTVSVNKKSYLVHRIIWKLVYGKDPGIFIDHIDNNKNNNTIENLREATSSNNNNNVPLRKDNSTGYKGVTFHKRDRSYRCQFWENGKRIVIGGFLSAKDAYNEYCKNAKRLNGEFANYG